MPDKISVVANKTRSALSSGLDVCELLAASRSELTLSAMSTKLGMSKSNVHSLLATLVARGYVVRAASGGYSLGIKVWELGQSTSGVSIAQLAAPRMARLSAEIAEGVILGQLDGGEVVYLHLVEGPQAVRVHASAGDRIPAHCTSTGLALLSTLSVDDVFARLPAPLAAITPATITTPKDLVEEIGKVRLRGYAVNRGGWRIDVGGVSVPICQTNGAALAALCVAAPLYRMNKAWLARVLPRLTAASGDISAAIATQPGMPAQTADLGRGRA
jgi:DNA-binding IclR family transcriptional regulator